MIIPEYISKVLNILNSNGYECYLVGGCVRDSLMGKTAHDFDLTTNALPHEIIKCFEGMRIIETGLKHGTVTVVSDGENVEITTYRIDGKYVDNRHPESVVFTRDIDEDLSRRDFTVNALAYSPFDGLVDLFDGVNDLEKKIIRCVGDPDTRFNEDGLRIMRALRFSSVLNFEIDIDTAKSIHKCKELLHNISRERIFSEFKKLICGENASNNLIEYFDVFCVIFPGLESYKSQFIKNAEQMSSISDDCDIRASALFYNIDLEFVKTLLKSLKVDNKFFNNVTSLLKYVSQKILCDRISVKYIMNALSNDLVCKLIKLKKLLDSDFDDIIFKDNYNRLLNDGTCVSLKQLMLNGNDLKNLGLNNGPQIGEILNKMLVEVIEESCPNEKTALINHLNKFKLV